MSSCSRSSVWAESLSIFLASTREFASSIFHTRIGWWPSHGSSTSQAERSGNIRGGWGPNTTLPLSSFQQCFQHNFACICNGTLFQRGAIDERDGIPRVFLLTPTPTSQKVSDKCCFLKRRNSSKYFQSKISKHTTTENYADLDRYWQLFREFCMVLLQYYCILLYGFHNGSQVIAFGKISHVFQIKTTSASLHGDQKQL